MFALYYFSIFPFLQYSLLLLWPHFELYIPTPFYPVCYNMGDDPSTKTRAVAPDVATMLGHLQPLFADMQAKLAAQLQAQLEDGLAKLALTIQQPAAFFYRQMSRSRLWSASKRILTSRTLCAPPFGRWRSAFNICRMNKRKRLSRRRTPTSYQRDSRPKPRFVILRPRRSHIVLPPHTRAPRSAAGHQHLALSARTASPITVRIQGGCMTSRGHRRTRSM